MVRNMIVKLNSIKITRENPRSQQSVNVLYCVFSMITTCFGLRTRPSSGDYRVIQNIKKKVTTRCNGSVVVVVVVVTFFLIFCIT
jgi:hypothetical protein